MFENKKILILGFARSGYEAAKFLISRGNKVILNDSKSEDKQDLQKKKELEDLGVKFIFGSHPDDLLDDTFDYLIKNPGVPIDHKYVLKARELGVEVINEVEMAARLLPAGVKLVGITGTNGKTTTTTLTYNILSEAFGDRVFLAGNIGFPLCSFLKDLKDDSIIVMEVSCQQLENISSLKPDVAVITNFSPAHIDFFKNYDNYKKVKTKLLNNQTSDDVAILNIENEDLMNMTKDIHANAKYFSSKNVINGSYLEDGAIYYYDEKVMLIDDVKIAGKHNLENVMAAIMVVKEFDVSGEIINRVVSSFKGVEHRLEYVDTIDGRMFYNDTEATNIKCTQIALSSFEKPIILILGGLERGQDFNELTPYMSNVKSIIGIGECRNRVLEYGNSLNIPTFIYEYLKDGFDKCFEVSDVNDIILLSPASASWDQYKECEVRGAEFKKKVEDLKNEN
ncbi:MAG: UDP-N-acetylmuramoyl-L-alanine--D-glutamate ligase [Bacilli bacterium]|nr:UDP-N-acetylmuramoyl-L-alanine--D-glutamate ligase [Bacilli bacterium]MCI8915004.1 UDP-N-acetylmuramoyl-L-alanine--D-glutamate ligase [Lawsonibacter sp.]